MMRNPFRPLALLVDDAAERWAAAEEGTTAEREAVYQEIAGRFSPGDRPELTFHGIRYLLTVTRSGMGADHPVDVHVHLIATEEQAS